jgi:Fe-S-cluster containining protein
LSDVPACLACGTCCFSLLETFVKVTGDDHARLAARAEELVRFDGTHAYMRMSEGHCSALEIHPRTGTFVCNAYELRPQVCRDLARASDNCLGERDAKSARPLLALRLSRAGARRSG